MIGAVLGLSSFLSLTRCLPSDSNLSTKDSLSSNLANNLSAGSSNNLASPLESKESSSLLKESNSLLKESSSLLKESIPLLKESKDSSKLLHSSDTFKEYLDSNLTKSNFKSTYNKASPDKVVDAKDDKNTAKKTGDIPVPNPVQISLIITNGMEQKPEKKFEEKRKSLTDILLKPSKSETIDKEDIYTLSRFSHEIKNTASKLQKMGESLAKILQKSKNYVETEAPERHNNDHRKDLVNYHVIEITENKNNKLPEDENKKEKKTEIETPKRNALLLSPESLVMIAGSPLSKRYHSTRKLDFEEFTEKKKYSSTERLNFL